MKTRQRGAVRERLDVDLYEVSPVLFGAHPHARVSTDAKSGRLAGIEYKAVPMAASVPHSTGRKYAILCGPCEQPIAMANRQLRRGTSMICGPCVDEIGRLSDPFDLPRGHRRGAERRRRGEDADEGPDFGTFDDDHPDDRAPRIRAEDAYGQAQDDE